MSAMVGGILDPRSSTTRSSRGTFASTLSVAERFARLCHRSGDCLEWIGAKDKDGYGLFKLSGRMVRAHRYAYEQAKGPIPPDLELDHLCRNHCCVEPAHLEAVTSRENSRRGLTGNRERKRTHCPRGHAYDEQNTIWQGRKRTCRTCCRQVFSKRQYQRRKALGLPLNGKQYREQAKT